MPRLTIDHREVEVPPGATILDAARKLGVEIPTLCFLDGHAPNTSCMVCLVKVGSRWVPSCATAAEEGMRVESDTDEVRHLRRTGLELLLSNHQGDCAAPCEHACPFHVDIPLMLRQVAAGDFAGAIVTLRREMPMPAVLARVGGDPEERACRRREVDSPAAIGLVKRFVAEADLASERPYLPPRRATPPQPLLGKGGKGEVAIVGAGPAGLSAAYFLLMAGHECTLFDEHAEPGGALRYSVSEEQLPRAILDREIDLIRKLGASFQMSVPATPELLADLRGRYDAVLMTVAPPAGSGVAIRAEGHTHETDLPGVFAAGELVRPGGQLVRLAADGKAAAARIHRYLAGASATEPVAPFYFHAGRLPRQQIVALTVHAGVAPRPSPGPEGLTAEQAIVEASRCLQCDCSHREGCKLRRYAGMYAVRHGRFRGEHRPLEREVRPGGVVYEPGKCILCGLCIQVVEAAAEPLGLTFVGRGFDVHLAAPFGHSVAEGLGRVAARCIEVCPTGALSLDRYASNP